jgi:hypothetical protein
MSLCRFISNNNKKDYYLGEFNGEKETLEGWGKVVININNSRYVYEGKFANGLVEGFGKLEITKRKTKKELRKEKKLALINAKRPGQTQIPGLSSQSSSSSLLSHSADLISTTKYEGYFRNGFYYGKGKRESQNGDYFIGEWKNGKMNGMGIMYIKESDNKFKGVWKNDKFENPKEFEDNELLFVEEIMPPQIKSDFEAFSGFNSGTINRNDNNNSNNSNISNSSSSSSESGDGNGTLVTQENRI